MNELNEMLEDVAVYLERRADEHNAKIAKIADVAYDPNRSDTGTAHGIRRAAAMVREYSQYEDLRLPTDSASERKRQAELQRYMKGIL